MVANGGVKISRLYGRARVGNLVTDSSILNSLNLTGVDPDNITCGVDNLVVGDCDVTEPRFVDNKLQQGYIYRITITPRSNGQDAQNGISNANYNSQDTNTNSTFP